MFVAVRVKSRRRADSSLPKKPTDPRAAQKLLRHVSAVDGMGVSDDARAYGSATYHCTSAHGPACPARGAVGELANPASPDDDDLEEEDDAVVIMHAAHVGGDVDVAQIMRMFENGAFDEALGRAKRKKNGNPEAKAEPEPEAAKRHDVAAAKRFFRARDNEHETDDVPTLARYGVTGEALPNDAATTWPSGVRSTPSRETRKVEFLNARSSTTAVYWVDFDGKETHYVDLPPGMSTLMSTFATHSWVARDMASARAIAVFTVQPRAESRSSSNSNSNARLTDQERPRRFVVVDAAERGDDKESETLVGTRREIPAPAPAEPTKPEKEPTDMQSDDRGRGGGEESRNANPADAARKASASAAAREL